MCTPKKGKKVKKVGTHILFKNLRMVHFRKLARSAEPLT